MISKNIISSDLCAFRFFDVKLVTYALTFCCFNFVVSLSNDRHRPRLRIPEDRSEFINSKFRIHSDTIILTNESRTMGAKYINETEVLSNEECLLWCLENTYCNVAVFEEMTRRSCFLFDCGPPTQSRCKFMDHKFYTSSIMENTQHSYELKQWGNEIKQGKESLTVNSPTSPPAVITTPISVPPATDAVLKSPPMTIFTSTEPNVTVKPTTNCRSYQFQCLNSTECIAIYNVCDGIPQCPDGSDEWPELHCPNEEGINDVNRLVAEKPLLHPVHQGLATNLSNGNQKPHTPVVLSESIPQNIAKTPMAHAREQYMQPAAPNDDKVPPGNDNADIGSWPDRYGGRQENTDYDRSPDGSSHMRSPFTHKHSTFLAAKNLQIPSKWQSDYDKYNNQPTNNLDQQYNPYEQRFEDETYSKAQQYPDYERTVYDNYHPDDNSLWVDREGLRNTNYLNNELNQQANAAVPNRRIAYPNRDELYSARQLPAKSDTSNRYIPLDKALIKQTQRLRDSSHRRLNLEHDASTIHHSSKPNPERYMPYEDMPRTEYRMYPNERPQVDVPEQQAEAAAAAQMYDTDEALRESLSKQLQALPNNPVHMYEPIALVPTHSTPTLRPETTSTYSSNAVQNQESTTADTIKSTPKPTKKQKTVSDESVKKVSQAELYKARSIRIHESNNAIVALTLGLIVSAFLILLVGCHLRTIKKRSLRRGRPLAHDADYLVNGLYL